MKKVTFLILIGWVIISVHAQFCHAGNVLTNSSFEEGEFPPADWADWSGSASEDPNNGIAGFPAPEGMSHSGKRAVGKILYGTGERWGGFSQTVGVMGARMFNASGWVMNRKTDVALGKGAKAFIEVKFLNDDEEEIKKSKSASITRATDWTKLTVRGLVPARTKKAIFSLVLTGPKGSRGKVFFDDAALDIAD